MDALVLKPKSHFLINQQVLARVDHKPAHLQSERDGKSNFFFKATASFIRFIRSGTEKGMPFYQEEKK